MSVLATIDILISIQLLLSDYILQNCVSAKGEREGGGRQGRERRARGEGGQRKSVSVMCVVCIHIDINSTTLPGPPVCV